MGFEASFNGHNHASQVSDRLRNILLPDWRSRASLELHWDYNQAKQKCVPNTGMWLLKSNEFKDWLQEDVGLIWLQGMAGCGKTILSANVMNALHSLQDVHRVAGYYFNGKESEKITYSRFLRSILVQLCPSKTSKDDLPTELREIFEKHMSSQFSDDNVAAGLRSLLMKNERLFIIIDALDECDRSFKIGEKSEMEKVIKFLQELIDARNSSFHVLITSRHEPGNFMHEEMTKVLQKCRDYGIYQQAIDLQTQERATELNGDIRILIHSELSRWPRLEARSWLPLSDEASDVIEACILERANGMFLLATCLLDFLREQENLDVLEDGLDYFPSELFEVYDRILRNIEKDQGKKRDATAILRWMICSERPLTLDEIAEIIMADTKGSTFLSKRRLSDNRYVSRILSSLITISDGNLVQFTHQTVREYLSSEKRSSFFFLNEQDSHAFVARCCLSYLQFYDQTDSTDWSEGILQRFPLLEYAVNNWYRHALRAWKDAIPTSNSDILTPPTTELGEPCNQIIGQIAPAGPLDEFDMISEFEIELQSSQCLPNWANLAKEKLNRIFRAEFSLCNKVLKAFACKIYQAFIERFLSSANKCFPSPLDLPRGLLNLALDGEYRGLVQLLLRCYPKVKKFDAPWWPGDSAPKGKFFACEFHAAIIRSLLTRCVDVNKKDRRGRTSLHTVASRGQRVVSEILLANAADVRATDIHGQTPLHVAAMHGHCLIVQDLLQKGANRLTKDKMGYTPLDYAVLNASSDFNARAFKGHEEAMTRTIRVLLAINDFDEMQWQMEFSERTDEEPDCNEILGSVEDVECCGQSIEFVNSSMGQLLLCGRLCFPMTIPLLSITPMMSMWSNRPILRWTEWPWPQSMVINAGATVNFVSAHIRNLLIKEEACVSFSSTAEIENAVFNAGATVNFMSAHIKNLVLNGEACVAFSSTAKIENAVFNAGATVNFMSAHIKNLVLIEEACVSFSSTAKIENAVFNAGATVHFMSAHIERLILNGEACIYFSSTAKIEKAVFDAGATVNFMSAHIECLLLNDEACVIRFLSSTKIDKVIMYGGTVELLYDIHRSTICALQGKEEEYNQEAADEISQTDIGYLTIYAGLFRATTRKEWANFTQIGGELILGNENRALHSAVSRGQDALVRLLLEQKADPHAKNGTGKFLRRNGCIHYEGPEWTPLHVAAYHGYETITAILLENEADVSIEDGRGHNAVQIATSQRHHTIVQLLEDASKRSPDSSWKKILYVICNW